MLAANLPPTSASDAPLSGVPTPADIDAAALKVAETLDGVLRNCPAAYTPIGTPGKRCVGVAGEVETVRAQLGAALGADLYGVWRSRDDQRTVFNWLKMPSGTVYLRVAGDEAASGRSLVYLDAPTVPAAALTPQSTKQPTPQATTPAASSPAAKVATAAPPVSKTSTFQATSPSANGSAPRKAVPAPPISGPAFRRTLQLVAPRLNGPDVRAAQNRLIALTLSGTGGQGDGWYGPNTAKTVRDFQGANQLKVTGVIDRATWNVLFSPDARKFRAEK